MIVAFIFWVATMGDKFTQGTEQGQPEDSPVKIPGGVAPAIAGGSPREGQKFVNPVPMNLPNKNEDT
jgi:hypothetical protein